MLLFSHDVEKRSPLSFRQVCQDLKIEQVVSTSTFINKRGHLYPDKIRKVRCMTENQDAKGVTDSSIICKTKESYIDVFEIDDNGIAIDIHNIRVPVDCIAYKV